MKLKLRLKVIYSIVLILALYSCKVERDKNFGSIDLLMQKATVDSAFPGAVLLFGKDSTVLYNKAFGSFTYADDSKRITTNSVFDLASVTKVVSTTSAAMILVHEKLISLDDKVIKYLPEFDTSNKSIVTIRHLLLHNSGLPAFKKYYDEYSTADEVINDIMTISLENPPGEKYVYSDLGMITLQKVIEKVTAKPLNEFVREKLFEPLGMNQTMYNPSKEQKKNCVPTELDDFWRMRLLQGEVHDERAYMLNGIAGHAGLFSTTEDLSKFILFLMNKGNINGTQLIGEEIINDWTTKQSNQSDRSLGWDTKSVEGYSSAGTKFSPNSFGHTGFTGTSIWVDKDSGLFVILLSNRVHPTRSNRKIVRFRPKIHDAIYEAVIH